MAKGLNQVHINGNVGTDPELRFTGNGTPVTSIRVATPTRRRVAEGEYEDSVIWHTIVLWRALAEITDKYVKKGDRIHIVGEIRYKDYEGKDGTQYKNTAEIHANDLILCGGGNGPAEASDAGADVDPDDDLPF